MIDGQESSGGDPPRRGEGDFFSERRARRAAESGEAALLRRAEAAEATVHTLERHVASLQQRLSELEDERRVAEELLEAEKELARERERELRRIRQREYAEQQLRVEAEERVVSRDRDSTFEVEQLDERLAAAEHELRALGDFRERLQRQLAEAEQATAAERAELARAEAELRARVDELERQGSEMQRELAAERAAREGVERTLARVRDGYRQLAALLIELKAIVARIGPALAGAGRVRDPEPRERQSAPEAPRARATAAERPSVSVAAPELRSRVARALPGEGPAGPQGGQPQERAGEMADALAAAVERLRKRAEDAPAGQISPAQAAQKAPPHKHSMSLIGRLRNRRKQRHAA